MDCAGVEDRLSELFAGEWSESERAGRIAALRDHARGCDDCGGVLELLDLLDQPPGERDLAAEPSPTYWEELRASVERRREAEETNVSMPRRRVWAAIAASLLLAVLGFWFLRGSLGHREIAIRVDPTEEGGALPPDLEELLRQAEPETALAGMDFLVGFRDIAGIAVESDDEEAGWSGSPSGKGGFLPDVEGIDAEDRGALLEWLREPVPVNRGVES